MILRAEHFHEIDRELVVLAGQRLMTWAHDFVFRRPAWATREEPCP